MLAARLAVRAASGSAGARVRRNFGADRAARRLGYPNESIDYRAVHRFLLHQKCGEPIKLVSMLRENFCGALFGVPQEARHIGVDRRLGLLGERAAGQLTPALAKENRSALRVSDRAERCGQAELTDHLDGKVGRLREVVRGPSRSLAEGDKLSSPAGQTHGQTVLQVVLTVEMTLHERKLLGDAERLASRQDGHLRHRIGTRR